MLSNIVLGWLNRFVDRSEVFVRNRAAKIVSLINAQSWYYVNTNINPADLATRGLTSAVF